MNKKTEYTESRTKGKTISKLKQIFLVLVVAFCIFMVLISTGYILGFISKENVKDFGLNVLTTNIGIEPEKDTQDNVNILLIGVGGNKHSGGFLSDAIILASFDTKNASLSMMSVPRDLYIEEKGGYTSKINSVFARGYRKGKKNIGSGAIALKNKVEDLVGVEVPYYAVIDFNGFEKFVDALGGIEIDVPETIYDKTYPIVSQSVDGYGKYGTFYLQAGYHKLDGATALKYARSRHSTSDFSRSIRQQQIISAIKEKVLQNGLSVKQIEKYYTLYKKMVQTNLSLKEMLGTYKYLKDKKIKIHSLGLNVHCSLSSFERTNAGCFLYYPLRAAFGGAAAILPIGASAENISFYRYTRSFAEIIMHNQEYLLENANIIVKNGIDKTFAKKKKISPLGWAMKVAVKLKKYGFSIKEIANAEQKIAGTTIVLPGTGSVNYSGTIKVLRKFIPIAEVVHTIDTGSTNFEIILGNDFISQVAEHGYDFNAILPENNKKEDNKK